MRASSDLIEQQIRRWELALKEKPQEVCPCVAISRFPGTPDRELGRRVAAALGYGLFGIELVDEIARSEGVNRALVSHLDEHVRHGLDRWLLDTFRDSTWTEKEYLHGVGRTVSALAQKGSAVFIGRGAVYLLTDEQALRVLLIGSEERRVQAIAAERDLEPAAARAALRAEEDERRRFLQEFVPDPDDPQHFDLVLNADHRSVEYWAEVVVDAVRRLS